MMAMLSLCLFTNQFAHLSTKKDFKNAQSRHPDKWYRKWVFGSITPTSVVKQLPLQLGGNLNA